MDFDEKHVRGVQSAKRVTIVHTPWMGDWFVSHSPRNGNSHAEGTWDHWVQLAVSILQHPATAVVRPEAHAAVSSIKNTNYYTDGRVLTDGELARLFGEED